MVGLTEENWIGLAASLFTTVSLVPQLVKMIRERKAEGVSFLWMIILFSGLCCWIWYGVIRSDWIIIISNAVSAVINAMLAIMAWIYKKRKNPV